MDMIWQMHVLQKTRVISAWLGTDACVQALLACSAACGAGGHQRLCRGWPHAKVARDPITLSPSCSPEGHTGRDASGLQGTPGLPA